MSSATDSRRTHSTGSVSLHGRCSSVPGGAGSEPEAPGAQPPYIAVQLAPLLATQRAPPLKVAAVSRASAASVAPPSAAAATATSAGSSTLAAIAVHVALALLYDTAPYNTRYCTEPTVAARPCSSTGASAVAAGMFVGVS